MSSRRMSAAVGLLLLTTGCSLFGGDGEDVPEIRREQTFASAAPRRLADAGPAPGIMREAWRIRGLGQEEQARYIRLEGGQLFIVGTDGFDVHDAGTGRKRWHYREPGRELSGFAVNKDNLVIASRSQQGHHLTGLAAGTGRLRWERGGDEGTPFIRGHGNGLAMGEGVVPLLVRGEPTSDDEEEQPDEFLAIDAATGEERWRRPHHGPGCETGTRSAATDTDGSVLVFSESCGDDHYVYAFNPFDGKPLWSRTGTSDDSLVGISVRAGATLIELDEHTRTLVGRDDREIARLNGTGECLPPCSLLRVGDDLGLRHFDESRNVVMSLIDVSNGKVRTLTMPHDITSVTAGGRWYGVSSSLAGTLLPAGLNIVDTATQQLTTVPVPLNLESQAGSLRWLGVAGDHLLVATSEGDDLIAYASTPAQGPLELGGVAKDDWPDACDLLKDVPGKTIARTPMVEGPVKIGEQELARSRCHVDYSDDGDSGQAIAEVEWVAAGPAEADGLVAGEPGLYGADEVQKTGESSVRVRKGRFVVKVQSRLSDDLQPIVAGVLASLG
ncbi:PQQ-like beta-propeller repeat protein [Nonomuraea sp. KC401]|uniref:outer membrane protein assembly factor BamB family protein n=1 Tax=unclassified Nonomuraea TaxID=2593643 RepID=UPI0010FDD160|nr:MULTISPECIES: PQQ-binding-like beta-propeller repeat protein [unclassified Nonomuraea]NBE96628.1 PQQ-binding-like beta-propeller repeat protein [Nonomuraea sp. K271]TLF68344.1 PQQ-like beta-propeller repeat protein [Nonomuraea sp. KC401]